MFLASVGHFGIIVGVVLVPLGLAVCGGAWWTLVNGPSQEQGIQGPRHPREPREPRTKDQAPNAKTKAKLGLAVWFC